MARVTAPPPVTVAPQNNMYTALALAGTAAVALGLIVLFLRANALGVNLLKF